MDVSADPVIDIEPGVFKTENIVNSTITATSIIVVKMETEPAQSVRVLNMGGTRESRLGQMLKQGRSIIILCKNSRAGISAERAVEMENRFADAELYLDWLDTSLEMTPDIRRRSKVDVVLQRMADPTNNVPENAANKAKVLLDKYEADNWGQDLVADEDSNEPSVSPSLPAASPAQAVPTEAPTIGVIQLPPANDPIFGERGIMYGVVIDMSSGRRTYRLRADIPRKSAKVYGHNDIALGTWYPYQINALFWGAHGARMGGIAGSVTTGAYSIVVSSTYEDLDTDNGDTLFYSGSNSHDNANPERPATPSQARRPSTPRLRLGTRSESFEAAVHLVFRAGINTSHPVAYGTMVYIASYTPDTARTGMEVCMSSSSWNVFQVRLLSQSCDVILLP
ncbi:hypothetical protein NUW58_g5710 [Xylaria curta]|uniref:Uncharacterized protein n=1 Tax=Xylaria curta TaxID=42375 RepID=A0ACC1P0A8_9PEZI|nr:hypothetical protein NUW58_g5710 [Xylaria curta]